MSGQSEPEEILETLPHVPQTPATSALPSWTFGALLASLSKARTFVGLTAGVVSITGALLSYTGYSRPAPDTGELVAIVRDRNDRHVADATIEVLTAERAVVTTLATNARGRASVPIAAGAYVLRARHPRLGAATRMVEVRSGLTAEVTMSLRGSVGAGATARAARAGTAATVAASLRATPSASMPAASPGTEPRPTPARPPSGPGRGGAQAP